MSIANHADRNGRNAWPSMETIALEARLSEREARYAIAELKELGELEVIYGGGRGRPNTYQLPHMVGGKVEKAPGCETAAKTPLSTAPTEQENGANSASFATENGAEIAPFTKETVQSLPPLKKKGGTDIQERGHTGAPDPSNSEPKEREEKERVAPVAPCVLVPIELWLAFVEMRKKIRRPLTARAGELIHRELAKFKARGFNPVAILENSIRNGWQDVYEPKVSKGEQKARNTDEAIERVRKRHDSGLA